MEWLNIQTSVLHAPEFIGSLPKARSTWFCVSLWCAHQENGGRIPGARQWKDRQWQQTCGVTRREVDAAPLLLLWDDDCLTVWNYPLEKEQIVRRKRETGREGGLKSGMSRARSASDDASPGIEPDHEAYASTDASTERKGKEGNGKEHTARAREVRRMLPPSLQSPLFIAVWAEWYDYLHEKNLGRSVPSQTFDSHLRSLEPLGPVAAAEALRVAIDRTLRAPALPSAKISNGGALERFDPKTPNAHTGGAQEAV